MQRSVAKRPVVVLGSLLVLAAGCAAPAEREAREAVADVERQYARRPAAEAPDPAPLPVLGEDAALEDYLAYAAMNNPRLSAALAEWRAAGERVPQARALPDPVLSYQLEAMSDRQQHQVMVSQALPWFGKLDLRAEVAQAEAEAARQRYGAEKLTVVREVQDAYDEYYYLSRAIVVVGENRDLMKYLEEVVRARYAAAAASHPDVIRAQVELGKLDDELRTLVDSRSAAAARLNAVLNRPAEAPLPWPRALAEEPIEVSDGRLLEILRENSPELKALDSQVAREERMIRLAEKARENGRDEAELLSDFWEATKSLDAAGPVPMAVTREGDDFRYTQESLGVEVQVSRVREGGEGIHGELTVSLNGRSLHWGRASLASLSARKSLTEKLQKTSARIPWADILERVCQGTTEALRATEPTVQLVPARGTVERILLEKLLVDHETNVVFADGGSGKSLLAQAVAVAIGTKTTLPAGLSPRRSGPVLYLDWESCLDEQQERLDGLLAGLGLSAPVPIHYRRMAAGLADDMPTIRTEVARLKPALVIVDSLAPACGMEPEGTDASIRTFNALRTLASARLVLAHVSKAHADLKGATRPFGSVFNMNLPRNVWELRRAEEDGDGILTVGAYHRKTNRGRLLPPFGLRFEFDKMKTRILSADLTQDEGLRARAGLTHNLRTLLRSGGQTIAQLAEELGAKEDTVQKAMYRLEKAGVVVRVGDIKPGPGKPLVWGLKA